MVRKLPNVVKPHVTPLFITPKFKTMNHLLKKNTYPLPSQSIKLRETNIILFGFGRIGQSLAQALIANRDLHKNVFHSSFNMKCIADSSGFIYSGNHSASDVNAILNNATVLSAIQWKSAANGNNSLHTFRNIGYYLSDFSRIESHLISSNYHQNTILVDCTSAEYQYTQLQQQMQNIFLMHSMNKNAGIVLANKSPLIMDQHAFDTFTSADRLHRFGYESTFGGCLPIISQLQNILISGDTVFKIEGIFSSAMGYILAKWQYLRNTKKDNLDEYQFAQIVNEAYEKKITANDPRLDLFGIECAQKALILARSLGMDYELNDVQINCSLKDIMGDMNMDVNEFLSKLNTIKDSEIEEYFISCAVDYSSASKNELFFNLKYIAIIDLEKESIVIELRNYGRYESYNGYGFNPKMMFANVFGTQNMVQLTTDFYGEYHPLIVQGNPHRQSVVQNLMQDLYKVSVALHNS